MGCREYIIMCFQNLEELIFSFIIWGDLGSRVRDGDAEMGVTFGVLVYVLSYEYKI